MQPGVGAFAAKVGHGVVAVAHVGPFGVVERRIGRDSEGREIQPKKGQLHRPPFFPHIAAQEINLPLARKQPRTAHMARDERVRGRQIALPAQTKIAVGQVQALALVVAA